MSATPTGDVQALGPPDHRGVGSLRRTLLVRGITASSTGRVGIVLMAIVIAIALLGPLVRPHGPTDVVGAPYLGPASDHLLGTDGLGRDVLARYLSGGRTLLIVAFGATALAYLVGGTLGLAAGYRRGALDLAAVWLVDLLLAFPPIIFVLTLVAVVGPSTGLAVIGIAAVHAPRIFRIVRAVAGTVATYEFVEAAVARGERVGSILRREILPSIWTPVMADVGVRLAGSVILFASLSFLGFGPGPPAADWGSMISDDRLALTIQPWVVVVPAVTIALLSISVSLIGDAIARASGRTVTTRSV